MWNIRSKKHRSTQQQQADSTSHDQNGTASILDSSEHISKPPSLMTYLFAIQFVLLSGSHANALIFGAAVLTASTPEGTPTNHRLQKLFAVLIVAAICLFQSFSRLNYVRFSNIFAIYKISLLTIITILGWHALATRNRQTTTIHPGEGPYGLSNLDGSFRGITNSAYAISIALLDIFRVYSGYENANFVCTPMMFTN